MNQDFERLLANAKEIYNKNFSKQADFERGMFFSWGCAIGDCAFCYMSTQPKEKRLKETRRSFGSILAEFFLAKKLGWEIGFLTGGIGVFAPHEMEELLTLINKVYGKKIWLSIGAIPKPLLLRYKPHIKGIVGSTETINEELHKIICPSKPLAPYKHMFKHAKELGIPSAMTMILGMGETRDDMLILKEFIKEYSIHKIHIYGLKPREGTPLANAKIPSKEEQAWWIAELRTTFPKIEIQCGVWEDRLERTAYLLSAGANAVSNFRATKLFGTKLAQQLESEIAKAERTFTASLTKLPDCNWEQEIDQLEIDEKYKVQIKEKIKPYLERMQENTLTLKAVQ